MRQILEKSRFFDINNRSMWHLTQRGVVVPEEVVYYYAGSSYTSSYPWIRHTTSSVHNYTDADETAVVALATIAFSESPIHSASALRTERIVVVTNIALKWPSQFTVERKGLREDIDALSRWNPDCKWHVNVVVSTDWMARKFKRATLDLPPFVEIYIRTSNERFNKYQFLKSLVSAGTINSTGYDYILLKDSDMRLAGFAWNTFMDRKGNAVVAGAVRQAVDESLARNAGSTKRRRQFYQIHDATFWKEGLGTTFWKGVVPLDVPIIEQYFALIQADFGSWFFSQILTDDYVSQPNDWGPDMMWCGAAGEYKPDQPSCYLVPVSILHDDTRTIKINKSWGDAGRKVLRRFATNEVFKRWLSKQEIWLKIMGGANVTDFKRRCQAYTYSEHFNIADCAFTAQQSNFIPPHDRACNKTTRISADDDNDSGGKSIIDRIYYINLKFNLQRDKFMQNWLSQQRLPFQRIEGNVGSPNDVCVDKKNTFPEPCQGISGLARTNIGILQHENTTGLTLVVEDDFAICDIGRLEESIKLVPKDWDIIRWDCLSWEDNKLLQVPRSFHRPSPHVFRTAHSNSSSTHPKCDPSFESCHYSGGTHVMLWRGDRHGNGRGSSSSSKEKLVKVWSEQPYNDIDYRLMTHEIKSYCVNLPEPIGYFHRPAGEFSNVRSEY
jgi:hypothetical protein